MGIPLGCGPSPPRATMPAVPASALSIEKRVHPYGAAGVQSSLEEVAKKIKEGYTHPKVRAWAVECLERARREQGRKADTERERAEILLRAVQKKLWVPDPVGAEWMAGAHLMACDKSTKDDLCILSGDCDDASVMLGSCFLCVGLDTMIVGHAYEGKHIEHVLCAVRIGKGPKGQWWYADPTTDFPLGTVARYSWERLLSVPNIQTLCDEASCLRDPKAWDPEKHNFVVQGQFVGVNGPPRIKFAWLVEPPPRLVWNNRARGPRRAWEAG